MRKNVKLDPDRFFTIINEQKERIAELEAELVELRQVVADVETCRNHGHGVTVFCDDPKAHSPSISLVQLLRGCTHTPFYAPTWQAALHAAAEHVRTRA